MGKQPTVSVVTPMFNAEGYIEQAVRSVMGQTYRDFEHIVVDDGSSDGSLAIVERLAAEDARIRLIKLPKNEGYSRATNHGLRAAKGKYVVCMDADDVSAPRRIEKQVAYLEAHPEVGIVGTQYWRLGPDGRVLRKTRNRLGDAALRFQLLFAVPFCNPSTAYRREIVEELGPEVYDPEVKAAPEYDFLLRAARRWKMHVVPDYLFYYRVHPGGMSKTRKDLATEEMLVKSIARIEEEMPELRKHRVEVEGFIRAQRVFADGMTRERLRVYLQGLEILRGAYVKKLDKRARDEVNAFAAELAAKTLLGRYRMFRHPALLWAWLRDGNSQLGHLGLVFRGLF